MLAQPGVTYIVSGRVSFPAEPRRKPHPAGGLRGLIRERACALDRFDVTPAVQIVEVTGAEMLDFQEPGAFRSGFVDAERARHAQGRGALQGADEAGITVQKEGLPRP
jgi:hypothetical protein